MSRLWMSGYRSYELGVFGDTDDKLKVIKYALTSYLTAQIEDGVDWLITGGQLGVEQWCAEVGVALKQTYPELKVAMMLPYAEFGGRWKENNQAKLQLLLAQVDFHAAISKRPYENPQQLRNYQEFMVTHTDAAALVYDLDNPGKPSYDYDAIQSFTETQPYPLTVIDFDWLQESANEYAEKQNNGFNFE
ncbi:hypothetical protein C5Z26_02115 [Lactobacillus sp. CBA3606]|uniref:DUF1273 domain-containing protein n=1 Tax=Lactobacillus sp. CBA3606 TaxID=2099789 RepID=UPI000CFBDA19|nr:DUF1273 domain-containing protein [Lactobacillus sp. CBA3606]AVK62991.1 hypothetical protein C5Z26_02115 [Lactobacillus sp. CBA3606]